MNKGCIIYLATAFFSFSF